MVLVVVAVLGATNLVTLAVLLLARRRRRAARVDAPMGGARVPLERVLADSVAAGAPVVPGSRNRRVIAVEILNPFELAGRRSRMFSLASSVLPELTHRLVYDQTVKALRAQLARHGVAAHVTVHTLPAAAPPQSSLPSPSPSTAMATATRSAREPSPVSGIAEAATPAMGPARPMQPAAPARTAERPAAGAGATSYRNSVEVSPESPPDR